MKITKAMSREEFAAAVVHQLEKHGLSAILVGGACVSIYTEERHASRDLDFISPYSHEAIRKALAEIGFTEEGRYFVHLDCELYVEFPSGPPAIGNEAPIQAEGELKVRDTIVKMYSPTQCVMDRLAAWFHWNDRRSLIHAIWVCEKHPINLDKIKRWAAKEGASEKFKIFIDEFKKIKK